MLRKLWTEECGAIISAELALVLTIVVLGVIVGLSEVAVAINTELNDISNAIGALDQSYGFTGFSSGSGKPKSFSAGTTHRDNGVDNCDLNNTCDIVVGVSNRNTNEGGFGGRGGR